MLPERVSIFIFCLRENSLSIKFHSSVKVGDLMSCFVLSKFYGVEVRDLVAGQDCFSYGSMFGESLLSVQTEFIKILIIGFGTAFILSRCAPLLDEFQFAVSLCIG